MKIPAEISSHKTVHHGGLFSIKNPSHKIIDFSSNISPIGPPPLVKKYLKKNLDDIETYPDSDSKNLKKNLGWYTGFPSSQIIVGNGATEIIYNFCQAFLSKKTKVLIPIPTFGEYEAAAKLHGSSISFFKTMNLNNDIQKFINKIPKHGCIFLCNPNNPTGILTSKNNIQKIIKNSLRKSTIVFVDECFIELVPQSNDSILNLVKKYENLFVLRSLTKSFGLAGIRIGYAIGPKKLVNILNQIKIPWNVSGLAQKAADAAICHSYYLDKVKKIIKNESKFLRKEISNISGFECNETSANFILIRSKLKPKTIQNKLLKKNILIRDCSSFRGLDGNYIRIAVKTRNENKKLIQAMKKI